MNSFLKSLIVSSAALLCLCSCSDKASESLQTFPLDQVTVLPELSTRIQKNFERLNTDIYLPPSVYEDKGWPGDYVGRTILGLTMDSQALHCESDLLETLIEGLPSYFNDKGYLGPDYFPAINEQQLSGHGWLLRGLCEYSKKTGDKKVLETVRQIAMNLFVPGTGVYCTYPIAPDQRTTEGGEASGSIVSSDDQWILSTDIGCIFIGMAGLIDAYEMVPDKEIKAAVDELIARFLEVDLTGIKAQTHATLSALRGLIKYAAITGDESLIAEAVKRWDLYVAEGMTCCYGNLNWFGRPDSWTEPCAIVDSYIVAFDLWKLTKNPAYRDMAELIATNAIGHAQRENGGFGCDSCPSDEDPFLKVVIPEASWCCTMRGAEGLSRIAESNWAVEGKSLYVPFYRPGALSAGDLEIKETTCYPDEGNVTFEFIKNERSIDRLLLPVLPWAEASSVVITINGEKADAECVDGFICISRDFVKGDIVSISFDMPLRSDEWNGSKRWYRGPVQLGYKSETAMETFDPSLLTPVRHLMEVMDTDNIQVLF